MSSGSRGENGNRNRERERPTHPGAAGRVKVTKRDRYRGAEGSQRYSAEQRQVDRLMHHLRAFTKAKQHAQRKAGRDG